MILLAEKAALGRRPVAPLQHFLIVEDNDDHALLAELNLGEAFPGTSLVTRAATHHDGLRVASAQTFTALLWDLSLPDASLEEVLHSLPTLENTAPVLITTNRDDPELARRLVEQGIEDYLPKSEITRSSLRRAIIHAIERRKLRFALTERNRDLETFVRSLGHDFYGPIRRVRGLAAALDRPEQLSPDQLKRIRLITAEAESLFSLATGLRALVTATHATTPADAIALGPILDDVWGKLSDAYPSATFHQDALPQVLGSAPQLQLLLQNLLDNALAYSNRLTYPDLEGDQHITVRLGREDDLEIDLFVDDNGIGIREHKPEALLEPLFRGDAKHPGSGLGLAVAARLAKLQGGRLRLEPLPEGGTRAIVTLPKSKIQS